MSQARTTLIPDPVTRVLASLGAVNLATGPLEGEMASRLTVAPFDDLLVLFASQGSTTLANLEANNVAQVEAIPADRSWHLLMKGHALATGPVNSHPRRLELQHWLPEGSIGKNLVAVEFMPEHILFTTGGGDGKQRFEGPIPEWAVPSFLVRWLTAAYSGILPSLAAAWVVLWVWIAIQPDKLPFRAAALIVGTVALLTLMGAGRLFYRAAALANWQKGRALRVDSGVLGQGWMAPGLARKLGYIGLGIGLGCLVALVVGWGLKTLMVVLAGSQLWFLGPVWIIHLGQRHPEPMPDEGDLKSLGKKR